MKLVFDIEADNLLRDATKTHCFCYNNIETGERGSLTNYKEIRQLLNTADLTLIGHNIVLYDIPLLERILNIKIKAKLIDTLPISWYLESKRRKHGLAEWGEEFGVKKPYIADWNNLSVEDYIHRCEEDVKINTILWNKQWKQLNQIYEDENILNRFIRYLMFKMDCVKEQEEVGIKLDVEHCKKTLAIIEKEKKEKIVELIKIMPKVAIKKVKKYENTITDVNGNFATKGDLFYDMFKAEGGKIEETKEIVIIKGYKEPNPNSHEQIKDWLYGFGWIPGNIKHVRNKETGETKEIPQIASKDAARDGTGEICESIKKLFEKEPKLELLDGLSVASHRIGLLKGFLENQRNGILYPTLGGIANTLRLKHRVIVNLPSTDKKWGKEIRNCLITKEGYSLVGSDVSGLEDNTKRHFIYPFDPKYVEDMNTEGWDSHLEIAMLAGMLTQEQVDAHKNKTENHKAIRNKAKIVNFSATYKIGAPALARNSGMRLREAKKLLEVYWRRNKAILDVEKSLTVKTINGQMWQLNPVNNYWYSLRGEKDRFSTLNQGLGSYVFDIWVTYLRKAGLKISLQMHDEIITHVEIGKEEEIKAKIKKAMELANERLKLNVKIGCSIDVGHSYGDIH